MTKLALVVFDLAGTTVKDAGQVADAFSTALREHGIEITAEQLNGVRGASKREALRHLIPDGPDAEGRASSVYASFRDRLARSYRTSGVLPMDGARELFEALRTAGVRVALNTGFDRDVARLLLEAVRWDSGIVDAIVCGDDVRQGRPAPYLIFHAMESTGVVDTRQVANVGDTVHDLLAGHNAGVGWNVGVLSGAHDRRRLEQAPHTHLVPSIADLGGLWRGSVLA